MLVKAPNVFDSTAALPKHTTLHAYFARMEQKMQVDPLCFLIALAYLNRLVQRQGQAFCPTSHNIRPLMTAALVIASKANDDMYHDNRYMSRCGGIDAVELGALEVELCQLLAWELFIEAPELERVVAALDEPRDEYWASWFKLPYRRNFAAFD